MAAPTQVGTAVATGGQTTTPTFSASSGVATGDHQAVALALATTGETVTAGPGTGWLLAGSLSLTSSPPATTDTSQLLIYVENPANDPGNASFSVTKSGGRLWRGFRVAYRGGPGWNTSSLQIATSAFATSHAVPAQTTTAPNSIVIGGLSLDPGAATTATVTQPGGWTELADTTGANSGGTTEALTVAGAALVQASPGTVNGTFTPSISDDALVWSMILPSDEVASDPAAQTRGFLSILLGG